IFEEPVAKAAPALQAVVVDLHPAALAPEPDGFLAQGFGPATRETEAGGEQHERAEGAGVASGVEGGEVSAEARANRDRWRQFLDALVDDFELAGDGELLEVAASKVREIYGDADLGEALMEKLSFAGLGSRGEAVQIEDGPHHSSRRIFARRRTWRSSPEKRAAMNARTNSAASDGPPMRAPRHRTFISSCSTPWRAEYVSWQTPARMSRTLLAAMEAPTPLPQISTPRSALPPATASATARAKSG